MHLVNFSIDRIIIHQVFRRDEDGNKVPPLQSHEYTNFGQSAMEEFKSRVRDAIGQGSKAVEMEIVDQEVNDLSTLVETMVDQDDEAFAVSSFDVAKQLTEAQRVRTIPGGIVVVFTGTQGSDSLKFLGVIKAEVHSGYEKEVNPKTNEISLKFVEELLLTPGTRMYKTATFFQKSKKKAKGSDLNDKWAVMVSDYQISRAEGQAAAQYFYSDFLGCGYPNTSARTTKKFYEATCEFISDLDLSEEEKSGLFNALTTYLKVDKSATISATGFSETYFDDADIQDSFTSHIKDEGLPTTAFTKDIEHIKNTMKTRRLKFRGDIKLIGPSEAFKDLVEIETVEGTPDESGTSSEWTRITIKDRIIEQG